MRISYNWLRQLLPELKHSAREVSETLTAVGLELEELIEFGEGLESVVLAEVLDVSPHPERGKLRLVNVSTGSNELTVVCGAPNVPEPGGLVVLAPLGTHLKAIGLTLTPKKLGGIVSEGMLCSEAELGVGSQSDGILTFGAGTFQAGTRFLNAFPDVRDTVYEIGVTPNRPDALGHVGVARDIAAALGLAFSMPVLEPSKHRSPRNTSELVALRNLARARCPRYGAVAVLGVRIAPSPEWVRFRLHSLGIRPISNVVDVTNLMLLEYGNPMHSFDLKRIAGQTIVIRGATPGEKLQTLDGATHELLESDLVIADTHAASALAGIMGGAESEITDNTEDVLLECAYFEPTGIRRTARRLGIHSDSSYRFERGVGLGHLEAVLSRAATLLSEFAGGKVSEGLLFADGSPITIPEIRLRSARLNQLLGVAVDFATACSILTSLGFEALQQSDTEATFKGTSFRPDVSLEADLIEEVARIRGLDAIPTVLPRIVPQAPSGAAVLERETRMIAASLGLSEAVTYSFVSEKHLAILSAPSPTVRLKNPLTEERSVLTTSLLPGLFEVVQRAFRRGENSLQLFTVASRFLSIIQSLAEDNTSRPRPRKHEDIGVLPEERLSFAAVLVGQRKAHLSKASAVDVFDAKGIAVEMTERISRQRATVIAVAEPAVTATHLHPRGAGQVFLGEHCVGLFGTLHPDVAEKLDLPSSTQLVELDLAGIELLGRPQPQYKPIAKLPAITRDIAVEALETLSAGTLMQTIEESAGELCESVELFDEFRGQGLPEGHRSLGFRLVYRDPNASTNPSEAATLTDKQVDKQHQLVLKAVEKLGVSLRA